MNKKRRLIPFHWLPASWGLKGRVRDEAEAAYYLEGEELKTRLEEIHLEYLPDDDPKKLKAHLKQRLRDGEIDQHEYAKQHATLIGEPWVVVKSIDTDEKSATHGSMELDWNDLFIKSLEEQGYGPNPNPEATVDEWLSELCRNIALDRFDGVADYGERLSRSGMHEDVILTRNTDEKDSK